MKKYTYLQMNKDEFIKYMLNQSVRSTICFATGNSNYLEQSKTEFDFLGLDGWFGCSCITSKELDITYVIITRMGGGYAQSMEVMYHKAGRHFCADYDELSQFFSKYWDDVSEYFEQYVWVEKITSEDK